MKLGVVGKAHGLRGAFFVAGRRDRPVPKSCKKIVLGEVETPSKSSFSQAPETPEPSQIYEIVSSSTQQGRPLLQCRGVDDRTAAETLTGRSIWVEREQISVNPAQEFLWADLVGCLIYDSSGAPFGKVSEVGSYGAGDVAVVQAEIEGKLWAVEVLLGPQFFNMDFDVSARRLDLVVDKDTFEGLWYKVRPS